jgi:hypothetical protein
METPRGGAAPARPDSSVKIGPAGESVDSAAQEAAKVLDDVETMSEAEMDALVTAQLGKLDQ